VEVSRWKWREDEHNNILEGRAGVASAATAARDPRCWGCRSLCISDSQVVIGVFAKGRSSRGVLNFLARKIAALSSAFQIKFYWRYMRTHRNHADGPSRGHPIGVAPSSDAPETAEMEATTWNRLPDMMYKLTKG
jgi:hypothetical protein